jgi:phenylalanyl-tRNA synthetase beta chain
MKVTLDWLREYVDFDLEAEELAERLTQAGLETEGIEQVGDETVIELETTSNRPDHLGALGVAREIAWICGSPLRRPDLSYETVAEHEGRTLAEWVTIDVQDAARCPRYIGRVAVGVKVGPSSSWLRQRIESIGLRAVNNVVDLTNYVLFEFGQPLHAFDLDRVGSHTIIVRRASQGERFTAINGRDYDLDLEDLVIADGSRPVAIAGVMGGLDSEVSEKTERILLESAWFEPVPVRRTSRRLVLSSDSSYRFERKVDPEGVDAASRRFLSLLQQEAGATVLEGAIDQTAPGFLEGARHEIALRPARVTQVLGIELPVDRLTGDLERLGFEAMGGDSAALHFRTPSFRVDVTREIDLVEEVARVYGLDEIPEGHLAVKAIDDDPVARASESIAQILVGAGFHEALTFAFTTEEDEAIESLWSATVPFEVRNPVRSHERRLRRSLLPRLFQAVRGNRQHGVEEVRLFEQARVFHRRPGVDAPVEGEHLAWVALGAAANFRAIRGVGETVLRSLGIEGLVWTPVEGEAGSFLPGKAAQVHLGGQRVGWLGAVSLDGVPGEVWGAEFALAPLFASRAPERRFRDFSRHPVVQRDLNVVLPEAVLWQELEDAVIGCDLAEFRGLSFEDIYRGKQVPAGHKSVLFHLTFQADERTLTRDEVDAEVDRLVARLGERFGAELRA